MLNFTVYWYVIAKSGSGYVPRPVRILNTAKGYLPPLGFLSASGALYDLLLHLLCCIAVHIEVWIL